VETNLEEGHLLPRTLDDVVAHAHRFLVLTDREDNVVACGEVAPLSTSVAEIRSLVVDERHRRAGLGTHLAVALKRRARIDGFTTLCAFTHKPASFARQGFSIVPHQWLPEKIATDCHACPLFRRCGQYAMFFPLVRL
jgi:amino-acid N-acetyltransferase